MIRWVIGVLGVQIPSILAIIFLSSKEWYITLIYLVFALGLSSILIWVWFIRPAFLLFFAEKKILSGDLTAKVPLIKNKLILSLADGFYDLLSELKFLLAGTSGTGHTMIFSARQLAKSVDMVKNSTKEVSEAIEGIAESNSSVVSFVEKTNEELNVIEEQMKNISEISNNLLEHATKSQDAVEMGREVLLDYGKKSQENFTANTATKRSVEQLELFSKEIVAIVDTINRVAEQTTLLALNASIEAARAGEAGRGFSVVAKEVGELAENSNMAADEIRKIITEINNLVALVKEKINLAENALLSQKKCADDMSQVFERIFSLTKETHNKVTHMSESNQLLNSSIEHIGEAMQNVLQVTQQTAATSEEVSASAINQTKSAIEIADASTNFARLVERLKTFTEKYKIPKVGYLNWTSEIASAYVFKHWLKKSTGLEVILVEVEGNAISEMYSALATGEFDSTVSCWTPNMHDIFVEANKEKLVQVGVNLKGAKTGLVVPDYVTIDKISELNDYGDKFNKKIYSIEKEAGISKQALQCIEDYNLDYQIIFGNNDSICSVLDQAINNRKWVVVTGWIPETMFGRWKLKFLEDKKESFGGEKKIMSIARLGLEKDYPILYDALQKFRWSVDDVTKVMEFMNNGCTPDEAAEQFLKEHPDFLINK